MVGTWTAPGRIYTVQFDDEELTLSLLKKTDIPEEEPISWMTFSVCLYHINYYYIMLIVIEARQKNHLWSGDEEMEQFCCSQPDRDCPPGVASGGWPWYVT